MGGGERPFAEPSQNAVAKLVSRRAILIKLICTAPQSGKCLTAADTQDVDCGSRQSGSKKGQGG